MIQKIKQPKLRLLNHISPSQYHSAISCPYKLVLANSFGYQPLLPLNVNAHFGSIIHKMIELISRGDIHDEQTFSENWINLISKKEEELKGKGLTSITPLKYFVTDFALKKNQVKNILKKKLEKIKYTSKTSSSIFYAEKRLENSNKSITGIADLVIESAFGATILDFKTGKIYSDAIDECGITEPTIKKEYEIQLKLYAHLYFLMNEKYPKALYIVNLTNDFIEVKFENADCERIYSEAVDFLESTNSFIIKNDIQSIANPSLDNCKYCSYRPACNFYFDWLTANFESVNDLFGKVVKVNQFKNNTLGLQLLTDTKEVLINGLSMESKNDFISLIGKNIILYNLKKTKQSLNATTNNFTVVYE
jgi:hypothetical protein